MIQNGIIQQIVLPSTLESLSEIENFIEAICEQNKFGEDHYGNILIALTEAVNNAITHGNKLNPDKKVNLNMETTTKDVEFTIKDEGAGFDYTNVPDPTLPENLEKLNDHTIVCGYGRVGKQAAHDLKFYKKEYVIVIVSAHFNKN